MKKIIILTMLLAFVAVSFGQQITPKQDWKESEYYKKSKHQKTAAWILLGSGVALITGGLIAHANYINNQDDLFAEFTEVSNGEVIAGIGVLVAGGSIPFFIMSSKNKKKAKAASVFINIENAPVLQGAVFNNQSFPAVGVKIHL
jgi:hypothetical protein